MSQRYFDLLFGLAIGASVIAVLASIALFAAFFSWLMDRLGA